MNYEKSWTAPGQAALRLDQELPIISEEEVLRYLSKNLDDQAQVDEIFGKIKSAIKSHKDKKDFKKNASKLAKHHGTQADNHDNHADTHSDFRGTSSKSDSPSERKHDKAEDIQR